MPRPAILTSAANPLLKEVRRAILRGDRTPDGYCVAEGVHLLEEALRSGCEVKAVLAAEPAYPAVEALIGNLHNIRTALVPERLFRSIAATENSQGVMVLVRPPEWRLEQLFADVSLVVLLDGLQDPGNAGTIVRTAEAFGATGIIFLKGSVSPFNPKTLRASAGSLFRVPLVESVDAERARAALAQNQLESYATVPVCAGARRLRDTDLTKPCALIIGSEGSGISSEMRTRALDISIPATGVESLNAAVAAAILLYEARRQRSLEG